jgi:hypothetical protein
MYAQRKNSDTFYLLLPVDIQLMNALLGLELV